MLRDILVLMFYFGLGLLIVYFALGALVAIPITIRDLKKSISENDQAFDKITEVAIIYPLITFFWLFALQTTLEELSEERNRSKISCRF